MNKVFKDQINKKLEVYVDDMLIKSRSLDNHLKDLKENFIVIRSNNVRINPTKCALGAMARKFLGFMLTKKGIEVNLANCKAIQEMRSLAIVNDVQRSNRQTIALS